MSAERFLDTNVLIYAFAHGDERAAKAEALLAEGGLISAQVLNEFVNVSHKKLKLSWPQIEARVDVVRALVRGIAPISADTNAAARAIAKAKRLSFYDALIVAAATELGAREILSEDMQNGLRIDKVTIRNPFA